MPLVTALNKTREQNDVFLRIHRSYIVNMNHVQEVTKNRIVMDTDTYLPIGDMYKDALSEYLADKYLGR